MNFVRYLLLCVKCWAWKLTVGQKQQRIGVRLQMSSIHAGIFHCVSVIFSSSSMNWVYKAKGHKCFLPCIRSLGSASSPSSEFFCCPRGFGELFNNLLWCCPRPVERRAAAPGPKSRKCCIKGVNEPIVPTRDSWWTRFWSFLKYFCQRLIYRNTVFFDFSWPYLSMFQDRFFLKFCITIRIDTIKNLPQ